MKLQVDVLKEDIKKGKQGNARECAIARAVKRSLKGNEEGLSFESVTRSEVRLTTSDGQAVRVKTPVAARKFIQNFDGSSKSKSKPLSFTLRFSVPAPTELSNGN